MRRILWWTAGVIAAVVGLLAAIAVFRTFQLEPTQVEVEKTEPVAVPDKAAKRLSKAIQIETLSPGDYTSSQLTPFRDFAKFVRKAFPETHRKLKRTEVPPCSLVYRWSPENPEKKPAVFMSHIDVVPADTDAWTHPPFSGAIEDGYIWGRGTLDIKTSLMGILEATEYLVKQGKSPDRTLVYAFGCDEEIGGQRGGKKIASRLEKQGLDPAFVVDEGHTITRGLIDGLDRPVGLVGLAGKGYLTLELTARAKGGHSSMPPKQTAVDKLSKAISSLEANRMPARLNEPTRKMFETLAPHFSFPKQLVFANLWLLEPLLLGRLTQKKTTNAAVRTTTAVTMIEGGVQDNVLPTKASAKVNFRLTPDTTISEVKEHVRSVTGDDIEVKALDEDFHTPPPPVSDTDTESFRAISKATRKVFGPEMLVAPALTLATTDSRYYAHIAPNVYRFVPLVLEPGDPARIHGVDERISVDNYRNVVRFYIQLISSL